MTNVFNNTHLEKLLLRYKNCNWQTEKGRLEVFLELSQNSQENKYVSLFFSKVAGLRPATLLKRDFGAGVFL